MEGDESRPSFGVRFLGSMGVNVDRGECQRFGALLVALLWLISVKKNQWS